MNALSKAIKLSVLTALITFFGFNSKAQKNEHGGICIDGQMVDTINCWGFNNMSLVFPNFTEKYKRYDKFDIVLVAGKDSTAAYVSLSLNEMIEIFWKAKYGVFHLSANNDNKLTHDGVGDRYLQTRDQLSTYKGDGMVKVGEDFYYPLKVKVIGFSIQTYDNDSEENKHPVYSSGAVLSLSNVIMAKLETKKIKTGLVKSIDWNQKCPVTGRYAVKIDKSRTFNDYFGIIRDEPFVTQTDNDVAPKVTAAGSPTTKIALPAKKKVIGKPTKIKGSASEGIVLSTSELKPLDKTKPGYFVEKESGVTQMDGYRNADKDLHGEVRNYDALTEGVIESIYNYFNGKREGLAVLYDYYTGLIKESGSYKNGEKNGEWKRYKNGVVVGTDTYINGVKQ